MILTYFVGRAYRLSKPFVPPKVTLKEVHDAVPKQFLKRNNLVSWGYIIRDIVFCYALYMFGTRIDALAKSGLYGMIPITFQWQAKVLSAGLWLMYCWWQGLVFTSLFCVGTCRPLITISGGTEALFLRPYSTRGNFFLTNSLGIADAEDACSWGMEACSTPGTQTT